jgi:UDP-N-acetylglucosamine:LPS N-acetylglucosamine transferase
VGRRNRKRILAVASSGGHWAQLGRIAPALDGYEVVYVTTRSGHEPDVAPARVRVVPDAHRKRPLSVGMSALRIGWIVLRERPAVVITTGAAPGYLALRAGQLAGAATLWIDSIANADELSLSGRMASRRADLCLTQWPHLTGNGVEFRGSVL